jgi:hypothetical protein
MKSFQIRSLSIPAIAFLVLTGNVGAQDSSPALLNSLEVQRFVKRAEPADNARLAAHFTALADRYVAEVKRHGSMAQSFGGNPNRSLASGMSMHCKQLADLNNQSATELRGLATYHQKLAAGVPATTPVSGSRFEGGAGAPSPSAQELNAMAAKASTPADHRALEEYFVTLARRYTTEATDHAAMANTYRGTRIAEAAVHCDRLVGLSKNAAAQASEAAAIHKQLAGLSR